MASLCNLVELEPGQKGIFLCVAHFSLPDTAKSWLDNGENGATGNRSTRGIPSTNHKSLPPLSHATSSIIESTRI